jgi:hypothetical protein
MGLDIKKAPFFNKQMVKDIVSLQFNPGEVVPTYLLVEQGISILTCRPKLAYKIENIKATEEARPAMAHTMQFNKVQRHQKTWPS